MSEILIDLVKNSTLEVTNKLLAAIASNTGGLTIKSFSDLQQLTRLGLASKVVSIGDQISCEKATSITAAVSGTGVTAATVDFEKFRKETKTTAGAYAFIYDGAWKLDNKAADLAAYGITVTGMPANGDVVTVTEKTETLVWDVIGIDHDTPTNKKYKHSITLQLHDCYTSAQFDAPEALYYAPDGLAAGTYNFTLLSGYETAYGGGKTYQFTLTKAVPAGGQITFPWTYQKQASTVLVSTYENATSSTAIESVSVTEGSEGTNLGTADGNTENMNYTRKFIYGSNRWLHSSIRQWLNSDKAANAWWKPQNVFDRPPSNITTAGFLTNMDNEFMSAIGKVKKRTARDTVADGGGYEDTDELIFLLSRSEMYGGLENNVNEGEPYPYYVNYSDLSTSGTGADTNRIKYQNGTAKYWWLRSPAIGNSSYVHRVFSTGNINGNNAYNSAGVAPACCIV